MKYPLIQLVAIVSVAILFLAAFVPLLVLSLHNHPSAADDYCFADTAVRHGFWQAQKFYYDGWTGRYFSNFLVHGNPLVWGWYDGFRLIPAIDATGLLLALGALVSELLRGSSAGLQARPMAWLTTALLFFVLIMALQSVVEAFFWTAAVASYTVPTAFTLYLLAVIIRWYRLRGTLLRAATAIWAAFLVFAIVGSGETHLILIVLLLLTLAGYRLIFQRTPDWFLISLVLVSFVSSWMLFRAPGNAIRMGGNPRSGEFLVSLLSSFGWLAKTAGGWLLKTPVLPLSLLFLPIATKITRPGAPTRALFVVPGWLILPIFVGLLAAMVFPSYYGIGLPPANRTMNVIFIFFLVGWFYTLATLVRAAGWGGRSAGNAGGWLGNLTKTTPVWVVVLAGVWIVSGLWFSVSMRQMYNDLRLGYAATYDREMTARHETLIRPGKTLTVNPISVYPPSLFVEDIRADPKFLWNTCQAGYYGHETITLK